MAVVVAQAGRVGLQAILGFLRRGEVRQLLAIVGVAELVDFVQTAGNDAEKARVPDFAIVSLRRNEIIMPLSKKRVFRLLTRPARPRTRTKTVVFTAGAKQDITGRNVEVIR